MHLVYDFCYLLPECLSYLPHLRVRLSVSAINFDPSHLRLRLAFNLLIDPDMPSQPTANRLTERPVNLSYHPLACSPLFKVPVLSS